MTALRRTQLIRFGVWVTLATAAVLTAVISARTETGVRRIVALLSPEPAMTRGAKEMQLAGRSAEQEAEQRRVSEAIRLLAADRDRLLARLSSLERNLEDVTGSIGQTTARPPAQAAAPVQTAAPPAQAAPAPPAPSAAATPAPAAPTAAASIPASSGTPGPNRVAVGHLVTGNPAAAESVATKTEFGVDLGGNPTVEGLRALWSSLKMNQPGLLEGLRPVMAIRDGKGAPELRLIAGPLANASIAARLCAALAAAGQTCQPAVFDGQRLALQ